MKRTLLVLGLLAAAGLLMIPGLSMYYEAGGGENCTRCHEMRPAFESWRASAHTRVGCGECHGDALTADVQFHMQNASRVRQHVAGEVADQPRIREKDIVKIQEQCVRCHRSEASAWQQGPHSVAYKKIFLDEKHNRERELMDDCLRCHGMHFEGSIRDVVTPINHEGPWKMVDPARADRPAVPCLACHAVHQRGIRHKKSIESPALAWYDRRSQEPVPVRFLPVPAMQDGDRVVKVSPDRRQALCYQCHAPVATRQIGSGDDRTPKGVHEGLSCLACHDNHRQTARASCATCHPRLSNCGLDVEQMDTTFKDLKSKHNVHWVRCADCHTKGVPPRKVRSIAD